MRRLGTGGRYTQCLAACDLGVNAVFRREGKARESEESANKEREDEEEGKEREQRETRRTKRSVEKERERGRVFIMLCVEAVASRRVANCGGSRIVVFVSGVWQRREGRI